MGGNSFAFVPLPPIVIAMGHSDLGWKTEDDHEIKS